MLWREMRVGFFMSDVRRLQVFFTVERTVRRSQLQSAVITEPEVNRAQPAINRVPAVLR